MTYVFKALPELVWAILQALGVYLAALNFADLPSGDWKAFALAIAGGAVRPVLAAILAYFSKSGSFQAK